MTSEPDKAKRWWPRWSQLALLIIVALGCAYLACWGATKTYGPDAAGKVHTRSEVFLGLGLKKTMVVAPFVVRIGDSGYVRTDQRIEYRRYYFWFFGYVAKLPYERSVTIAPPSTTSSGELTDEEIEEMLVWPFDDT